MATQTLSNDQQGDVGCFEHFLAKKGKKVEIYMKIQEVDTGVRLDRGKTIGTITRKNCDTVLMCAVSGYSTGTKEDPLSLCLDTKKWNSLCLHHIAKQIKFRFPGNIRDTSGGPTMDEFRGRAHAGHVEVLLASWYLVDILRNQPGFAQKSEEYLITQLKRIRKLNLGDKGTANINIDSQPCRVCLQFLNQLYQYTGVVFPVMGSRGVGPIQVRVEGERRLDTVGDVFVDSEDELPEEANMLPGEVAGLHDAHRDGATPEIPAPSTPTPAPPPPLVSRRPGVSWGRVPTPWTPENAEALVSAYRKKTPVYEDPGYDLAPAKEDGRWEDEWEDMGDGVLMYCTSAVPENPGGIFSIKREDSPHQYSPTPVQPDTVSGEKMDYSDGSTFAQSAYETTQATLDVKSFNHRVVKRQRKDKGIQPPHIRQHLANFQHSPINDTNESIFKTRYSILKPKNRHLDPRSGRIF